MGVNPGRGWGALSAVNLLAPAPLAMVQSRDNPIVPGSGVRYRGPQHLARIAPRPDAFAKGSSSVVLSEIDRGLLERCLQHKPRAWEDFVDRFMGLVVHVVSHTASARSLRLATSDRDDLCAEVFLNVVKDDYLVLRHFRGHASLATYLTVVARRVVVRKLLAKNNSRLTEGLAAHAAVDPAPGPEQRLGNLDQVERLLHGLDATEAKIVRMYHLEGNTYHEISSAVGVPENSIGPILSRARLKMREHGAHTATN